MSKSTPLRTGKAAVVATPGVAANRSLPEIFLIFLRLGLTCFGGPIAHLGYFRAEFVERRQWLTERTYVDLVALSQFLPGPASSQTGFGIGLMRGGLLGGLAAWAGFTLPSAVLLVLFAFGAGTIADSPAGAGLLHGLKLVAVVIVAQAVMGMARSLCPDRVRSSIAAVALIVMLLAPWSVFQIGTIVVGGLAGWMLCRGEVATAPDTLVMPVSRKMGIACLAAFFFLLAFTFSARAPRKCAGIVRCLLPFGAPLSLPVVATSCCHSCATPLSRPGWVSDNTFLAGYGAAQAVPGPLFTFSAYLGAVAGIPPGGIAGAVIALVAIFVPGILCLLGTLPFWHAIRATPGAQAAIRGTNATVVGLLGAALYNPVWTSAVRSPADFAIAATGFVLLVAWRAPPLVVVVLSAFAGVGLSLLHAQ